jgi:hypothetical protein
VVAKHGAITNGVTEAGCAAFPVRSRDGSQRGDGARRIYLDLIKGWMSRSGSMSGSPGSRAGSIFR